MSKPDQLFRSEIARGIKEGKSGVDREHAIIRGYAVMSKMADTRDKRGVEIDDTTLEQIVAAGNKFKIGMKSRFGHPGMSTEALGTFLGRSKNFRIDGDVVRADLFLDETAFTSPNGNLAQYVMDLAESDPAAFGSSAHMRDWHLEYRLEKNGSRKKDAGGKELPGLLRVKTMWAVDIVEEPAANEELFNVRKHNGMHFFTGDLELSAKCSEFLDKFLSHPDAVEKTIRFLERYRVNLESEEATTTQQEEITMELDFSKLTLEQLKAGCPGLVAAIENAAVTAAFGNQVLLKEKAQGLIDSGVAEERARAQAILGKADSFAEGVPAAVPALKAAAFAAIKDGLSIETAESNFKSVKLGLLQASSQTALGHAGEEERPAASKPMTHEEHLAAAKVYREKNKCSITEALKATAPAEK